MSPPSSTVRVTTAEHPGPRTPSATTGIPGRWLFCAHNIQIRMPLGLMGPQAHAWVRGTRLWLPASTLSCTGLEPPWASHQDDKPVGDHRLPCYLQWPASLPPNWRMSRHDAWADWRDVRAFSELEVDYQVDETSGVGALGGHPPWVLGPSSQPMQVPGRSMAHIWLVTTVE